MANIWTQIYIHSVFAVQGRQNLVRREHNDELLKTNSSVIDARALAKSTSSY
jgi:hypothetical protein